MQNNSQSLRASDYAPWTRAIYQGGAFRLRLPSGGWSQMISGNTFEFTSSDNVTFDCPETSADESKGMVAAKVFERDGIEFIPMPVTSDIDRKVLVGFLEKRLEELKVNRGRNEQAKT